MRPDTWQRFRTVHTWCGVAAAWALFIVFFAGSITLFPRELQDWTTPELRREMPTSVDEIARLIDLVVAQHPLAVEELNIALAESPRATASWSNTAGTGSESAQLVGAVLASPPPPESGASEFIYQLHYTLGLPESIGSNLIGLICVIYGLALVSGVLIYAANLLPNLFALRLGQNVKLFWQDAHAAIGVLSLPFHLIFAYTGAVFTILPLLFIGLDTLALDGRATPTLAASLQSAPVAGASGIAATMRSPGELIAIARERAPTLQPTFLTYRHYGDANGTLEVYGDVSGSLIQTGTLLLDASTGRIIVANLPGQMHPANASLRTMLALHYGRYGGLLTRGLYFILGLAGALLFYTGVLLWLESRRRRREAAPSPVHRTLAQLTVGICIGCCLGIACLLAASLLQPIATAASEHWLQWVYFLVFFASIAYALLRPPARAAAELLGITAAVAASLPIINAVMTGDHLVKAASEGLWGVFGVDLVALLLALGFAVCSRAVARRATTAPIGSVWRQCAKQTKE